MEASAHGATIQATLRPGLPHQNPRNVVQVVWASNFRWILVSMDFDKTNHKGTPLLGRSKARHTSSDPAQRTCHTLRDVRPTKMKK